MSDLERAISIAVKAHEGQLDKAGCPYILHPLRLMFKFKTPDEMVVAVLHDVVEDSSVTLGFLKDSGFSSVVVDAIESLTKVAGEPYEDFLLRVSSNEMARKVKIEDIKDNLDLSRLGALSDEDLVRIKKYHKALVYLSI